MGAYTEIKGWIQLPELLSSAQANQALEIIERSTLSPQLHARFNVDAETAAFYNQGWLLQQQVINGGPFLFYGASIRTHLVGFIKAQVAEIAALNYMDEDLTAYAKGMFFLDEDGTYGHPPASWIIRQGGLIESSWPRSATD